MTKQQIHKEYNPTGSIKIAKAIDDVIQEYESRTCENCKFSEEDNTYKQMCFCVNPKVSYLFSDAVQKDFKCGEWSNE